MTLEMTLAATGFSEILSDHRVDLLTRSNEWLRQERSAKRHARQFGELGGEMALEASIRGFLGRRMRSAVMPVPAADHCRRIIADCQPRLRELPSLKSSGAPAPPIFVATQPGSTH